MLSLANAGETFDVTGFITPYLPLLGIIAGAVLMGIFGVYNRAKGNVETRAPDVNEIWVQQKMQSEALDNERKMRRKLEDWLYGFRRMFILYVQRVQSGGNTDLTANERKYYDTEPTTVEMKVVKNKEAIDG